MAWPSRSAFLVAIFVGTRTAARTGEDPDKVRDLCFWLLVSSLVGARLVFIATNMPDYVRLCRDEHDCFRALRVWEGGLVFYGGFFAALAVAVCYTRRHAMSFWRTADILAPSVVARPLLRAPRLLRRRLLLGQRGDRPRAVVGGALPAESLVFQDYAARGALPDGAEVTPPLHPVQLYEASASSRSSSPCRSSAAQALGRPGAGRVAARLRAARASSSSSIAATPCASSWSARCRRRRRSPSSPRCSRSRICVAGGALAFVAAPRSRVSVRSMRWVCCRRSGAERLRHPVPRAGGQAGDAAVAVRRRRQRRRRHAA